MLRLSVPSLAASSLAALTLAFAPGLLHGSAPRAAQQGDLAPLVERELAGAAASEVDALWARALGLRDLADAEGEQGGAALDELLDRTLADVAELGPHARLLAVATRLGGQDADGELLASALEPLLEPGADTAGARAALELLAGSEMKSALGKAERDTLGPELLEIARDETRDPAVRLAAAGAASNLGGGRERAEARREMRNYLIASDPELRALGALALAAVGEAVRGDLLDELERLAALPGERGALAASYLKQEDIRRTRDERYRRLERDMEQRSLPKDLATLNAVMAMIEALHLDGDKYTREELVDAALNGLLWGMDEHSSYMGPEVFTKFNQDLQAEYGGIGAYVGNDPDDGLFTITRPIYSGPAYKAGLQTDDKIVRIDDWPTHERGATKPTDEIIKRLKGRPETTVRLYIWRRGMDADLIDRPTEDMVVEIVREQIEIPAVQSELLPGGIGMVSLTTFSRVATSEIATAIEELREGGMQGMILDLRNNSGGLLTEAAGVADLFLPAGLEVVTTAARQGKLQTLGTRHPALVPADMPLVVLINRYSASASEIVAGALQDHGRATLVGERSFGKGSVQNLIPVEGYRDDEFRDENRNGRWDNWEEITADWDDDGEYDFAPRVKLTIAHYLLPSGRSIHRLLDRDRNVMQQGGVEPDLVVEMPRIEAWRWEERVRLTRERAAREYVDGHWDDNADLFRGLALTDGKSTSAYPDFADFYAGLDTRLDEDDVRRLVRSEVRRRVQDERGSEFPLGDYQEDVQVQRAINEILSDLEQAPSEYPEYAAAFDDTLAQSGSTEELVAAVHGADASAADVERARERLAAARDGDGVLSREELDELLGILDGLEHSKDR